MWIFPWIKLSWHSCSVWDKHGWLSWFWQFLCEGLSSFNLKDSHMHDLVVHIKKGLPFAWDLSLENVHTQILTYVFDRLYFTQCLTSFSSIDHLLCLDPLFLILFHLTDEVLSINLSANEFVFGDFNIHHKDWWNLIWPILVELLYLVNSIIIFFISDYLTQMVNFLLRSQTVILTVLLFWISFFLLMLVFVLQKLSLH